MPFSYFHHFRDGTQADPHIRSAMLPDGVLDVFWICGALAAPHSVTRNVDDTNRRHFCDTSRPT